MSPKKKSTSVKTTKSTKTKKSSKSSKRKKIPKVDVKQTYMDWVLEHGEPPASVAKFCKKYSLSKKEFFKEFGSFSGLESKIYQDLVEDVIGMVSNTREWAEFSAHQKVLTFFFTFTENSLGCRDFLLNRFPKQNANCCSSTRGLKKAFSEMATDVLNEGKERGELASRGGFNRVYPRGLTELFLRVIKFNLDDTSEDFQRTDAFIEKSTALAFDIMKPQALDSAFDLLRFVTQKSDR